MRRTEPGAQNRRAGCATTRARDFGIISRSNHCVILRNPCAFASAQATCRCRHSFALLGWANLLLPQVRRCSCASCASECSHSTACSRFAAPSCCSAFKPSSASYHPRRPRPVLPLTPRSHTQRAPRAAMPMTRALLQKWAHKPDGGDRVRPPTDCARLRACADPPPQLNPGASAVIAVIVIVVVFGIPACCYFKKHWCAPLSACMLCERSLRTPGRSLSACAAGGITIGKRLQGRLSWTRRCSRRTWSWRWLPCSGLRRRRSR
jgi:hypothetical protein